MSPGLKDDGCGKGEGGAPARSWWARCSLRKTNPAATEMACGSTWLSSLPVPGEVTVTMGRSISLSHEEELRPLSRWPSVLHSRITRGTQTPRLSLSPGRDCGTEQHGQVAPTQATSEGSSRGHMWVTCSAPTGPWRSKGRNNTVR